MISTIDLFALSLLSNVGDQTLRKIINSNLTISELRQLDSTSIEKIFSTRKSLESFRENLFDAQSKAEAQIDQIQAKGITIVHYWHQNYPISLRLLDDYPIFLYCRGNINLLQTMNNVAVIGTRECSEVGVRIARSTSNYFAEAGYTIVSGLAKGIDTTGHVGALEVGGKTIAVLIDVLKIYPKENQELAVKILENEGLLISENLPGSFQAKSAFVLRDRIQSGLSLAIFPIETDVQGGTMHTVKYATEQNRLIFVPDVFNSAIQNQYERSVGSFFSKIAGIKHLIIHKKAISYIKDHYAQIQQQLFQKQVELSRLASSKKLINNDAESLSMLYTDEEAKESSSDENTRILKRGNINSDSENDRPAKLYGDEDFRVAMENKTDHVIIKQKFAAGNGLSEIVDNDGEPINPDKQILLTGENPTKVSDNLPISPRSIDKLQTIGENLDKLRTQWIEKAAALKAEAQMMDSSIKSLTHVMVKLAEVLSAESVKKVVKKKSKKNEQKTSLFK